MNSSVSSSIPWHPWPGSDKNEEQVVVAARKLEDKAIKCITIAQRMLPNAPDNVIEEQASDLMLILTKEAHDNN